MGLYGDPDELDRPAARLRENAARIRDEAATHEARGHATAWVPDGAVAYRERLSRDRAEVERQAVEIGHAAALLGEHAASVRQMPCSPAAATTWPSPSARSRWNATPSRPTRTCWPRRCCHR
ncbi:hypothetical protein [Actinoplanes sp. NPDC049802]|uniref:hypothetical protein n=1 Tax=Actinoplanes sp. NPDC049802 TaxID=3154742 RepID=UPI00340F973A